MIFSNRTPRWKIVENTLPDRVRNDILNQLGNTTLSPLHWTLLSSGNSRRIYRYRPEQNAPAWLVKWTCWPTFGQRIKTAFGYSTSRREAVAIKRAMGKNVPTLSPVLVAEKPYWQPDFQTLLVMEFLEGSQNLFHVFKTFRNDRAVLEPLMTKLLDLFCSFHGSGLVHGDFKAENVLVTDTRELFLIDLYDMKPAGKGSNQYLRDVRRIAYSMMRADLSRTCILGFLKAYSDRMNARPDYFVDWLPQTYPKYQLHRARRAARNCIRRNHAVQHFTWCGYRVVMMKGEDELRLRQAIRAFVQGEPDPDRFSVSYARCPVWQKKDTALMRSWRMQVALKMLDVDCRGATAFAFKRGYFRHELLIARKEKSEQSLEKVLARKDRKNDVLISAGKLTARLHKEGMNIMLFDPGKWRIGENLFCAAPDTFCFLKNDSPENRFDWLAKFISKNRDCGLGVKDLAAFLRAYCRGRIDRGIWAALVER